MGKKTFDFLQGQGENRFEMKIDVPRNPVFTVLFITKPGCFILMNSASCERVFGVFVDNLIFTCRKSVFYLPERHGLMST